LQPDQARRRQKNAAFFGAFSHCQYPLLCAQMACLYDVVVAAIDDGFVNGCRFIRTIFWRLLVYLNDIKVAMMLDETDLQILRLLQQDGRIAHAAIGKAVNLTGPSVYARIQRMEREGIIGGYTALINPVHIEQGLLTFVRIKLTSLEVAHQQFEAFVAHEPLILECHHVAGEDAYLLKVRTANPQTLQHLITRIRRELVGCQTISSIVLETVKEHNATGVLPPPDAPSAGDA
jgi:Lrp/AsnC family leucine-responsive transcriptional regulator